MKKVIVLAALAAVAFATSAFAATYGDERCRSALKNGVVCKAYTEPATLGELAGRSMPFTEFVKANSSLASNKKNVSKEMVVPANQYYIIRYTKSQGKYDQFEEKRA